ncbi:hypothetical protein AB0M29_43820 [Streptomyces sp. NPDC051976]|uniref:hypothetical protein n=1 Tax=Streptomyces sp. NPDC051976 TaxID=3154947 RepID=UPI003442A223
MTTKSLEASDITVTTNSSTVVSPFDCSWGPWDDNNANDSGLYDGWDDTNSGARC